MPGAVQSVPLEAIGLDPLRDRTIAVLGFGAQGQAHAQNLRDSQLRVIVGQRPGGPGHDRALAAGFLPLDVRTAAAAADLIIFALPDETAPRVFAEQVRPVLRAGQALGFIHGLAIHTGWIRPPHDVDVVLVAPKAQGRAVRQEFLAGRGVVSLVAVHQDSTGRAMDIALAWAAGIGSGRAGVLRTTFADETETDLFGEQAVLCGGLPALIRAAFETLVEAGYAPELAWLECCHEVKAIADLIHDHGLAGMEQRISTTARYGGATRGPRIIGPSTRQVLREILQEIRTGQFAAELRGLAERVEQSGVAEAPGPTPAESPPARSPGGTAPSASGASETGDLLERVGATLRGMMRAARGPHPGG